MWMCAAECDTEVGTAHIDDLTQRQALVLTAERNAWTVSSVLSAMGLYVPAEADVKIENFKDIKMQKYILSNLAIKDSG